MMCILAIGGGGFLMEGPGSPIDEYILQLTGRERPRICFVPTASGDLPEHLDRFYAAFGPRRCQPSHVAFFRRPGPGAVPPARLGAHLSAQDAILVGGGNTRSALAVWREWGLDLALREALAAGVVLSGMSAGALCWFEYGFSDAWGARYRPLKGLGLLPGGCATHYGADPAQRPTLVAAIDAGSMPASVAIGDYAAVLYQDGTLHRVVSWREGAAAYRVALEGGSVREMALPSERLQ
jgi:dipeptidase E